ncbi:MAG TPA: cytochrome c [Rhodopila sp.]
MISSKFTAFAGFAIGLATWTTIVPTRAAPSSVTAAGITLHSVSVELPASDRMFPGGSAAEAINNNCLTCHSAGMVLNQPNLSQAGWQAEVGKMRAQYKAPVEAQDVPAIVAWLTSHKGAQ